MANNVSPSFAERWSKRIQVIREPTAVYAAIANYEERSNLEDGDVVHRPYATALHAKTLPSTGAFSRQDLTLTDESLTVDQKKEISFFRQDYEKIQASIPFTDKFAKHAGQVLINAVDGDVLGEYDQADSVVANYEISGSGSSGDGIGFTLTTSNILKVFALANRKLDRLNIPMNDRWAVISGEFRDILFQYLAGKESALGDSTGKNGHIGKYAGFKLYLSNACGWSGRLEWGTNPTNADTVTINGVAVTFLATLAANEGEVHICSTAAKTLDEFVEFINAPETSVTEATDAGITALSTAAYLKAWSGIAATDGATYLTIKAEGKGWIAVSETLTAAADIWTTTKQLQHCLFGQGKPTDLVIQKFPKIETQVRSGYIGRDFVTWELYGLKTFDEGDAQLVDVQIRSDAY